MGIKIKAGLTISRPQCGDGTSLISIKVTDKLSRARFLELDIPLDSFSECLTGLAEVSCDGVVRGVDIVGKKKLIDRIEFCMPECKFEERKEMAKAEAMIHAPEGWQVQDGFNSKDSFFSKGGDSYARCTIAKYIDATY